MNEHVYTNYRLQLPDQEVLGTLVVRDGAIADIQPGLVAQGQNGDGDYLLPGLIELHTDNLEQCISPRPKVRFPLEAAVVYHDRELISAGVTTVCDAIAVGDITPTSIRLTQFAPMINAITDAQTHGRLTADHRLHLRCELAYEHVCDITAQFVEHPLLALVSLMDHTPGQRQFANVQKYREYYMGKHHISETEIDAFIQDRIEAQQRYVSQNRQQLVELMRSQNIPLASHDDATVEHVQEAIADGAVIAEFPTTIDAAKASHQHGLQILMGAPNLVLGGSHSGNVSAMELAELDLVDIFSSDYVPQSLLQAMFLITRQTQKPLYKAAKLFTLNSAKAIGLDGDRGSLAVGKRADFITVHDDGIVPRLTSVVRTGRRVA
ncbi:phosphonate metabolism protein PhnM [Oscillatoria sp. FACHB-1407]|uniref:phosphonate metabolism protein PhnM n=1 Tax=Oscillatoria sp. FACHB-1407 TaxID=2692847 RepID=UPI0016842370|nr:phosphonate metabolism protein PhnM [Oscillatoria sp. FACHB-1407]MBD2464143.1 phosphonate metabolism protein PhnM [Oscillatoria sp. FACHB-1407]